MTVNILDDGAVYDDSKVPSADINFAAHLLSTQAGAVPATSGLDANLTSATFTGNDTRGTIALVVGAAGIAINHSLCTCTFKTAFTTTPKITLVNQTSTGLANVFFYVVSQSTGVSFVLGNGTALLVGTYTVDYVVVG